MAASPPTAGRCSPAAIHRLSRLARLTGALCLLGCAGAGPAWAHGISGRASLPVPAWLFGWAAAIVLVVSFAGLSLLWSAPRLQEPHERPLLRLPAVLEPLAGAVGLGLFALVVFAGYAGVDSYTRNFDPTFIYVIFWVGIPVASVVVGDAFRALSPWRAAARGLRFLARLVGVRRRAPLRYPERLGRWPAAAGLLGFGWLELIYHGHDHPALLATLALGYFACMLAGMGLFGIETWSRRGDGFGVYFGLVARLAVLDVREGRLVLRRPLSGVAGIESLPGTVATILVIIGVTTFDGASNGVVWNHLGPHIQSAFSSLGAGDAAADELADSVGLLIAVALVSTFFCLGVLGMRSAARSLGFGELSRSFAHSLVPIAFAYILAHYFSLLVWQGQAIGYLASDPLGHGANLLGTARWTIDYGVIGSTLIWYVQVAALVVGHVGGLTLAHDRALGLMDSPAQAARSQGWMLAVMVAFTCLGLWLLSSVNT